MIRIAIQKRISHRIIPNLIDIFFSHTGIAGMEIQRYFLTGKHRHILGQKAVKRRLKAFTGDRMIRFYADTVHIGMDAGICPAASFNIHARTGNLI